MPTEELLAEPGGPGDQPDPQPDAARYADQSHTSRPHGLGQTRHSCRQRRALVGSRLARQLDQKRFAENLRAQRARLGMSQEAFGLESGLHRTEISLLERGGRDPRLSTIVRLARALGTKPASLLDQID